MKHNKEKLIKIMNQLVCFCLSLDMKELNINFKYEGLDGEITIEGYSTNPPLERLKKLEKILNSPRQEELEEYYWSLMGTSHICGQQELEMLGTLVDGGSIGYEDNILTIRVFRNQRH